MPIESSRFTALAAIGVATLACGAGVAAAAERPISLTQEPLVMRLSKDEFRIAFGLKSAQDSPNGCSGVIRYRVDWKTADGATRSEIKRVGYSVSPQARRTIAVDRQYFDTAEGRHTTDVVKVSVDAITCRDGADERATDIERL